MRTKLRSVKVGLPGNVDGVPVDTIEAEFRALPMVGTGTIKVAIGRHDHLVRQCTTKGSGLYINETLSDVRVNPSIPPSVFRFTPPAGSKVAPAPQ
ncbi:MAG: hypothetical protein M3Y56_00330 [Armatimonadota bacterium]|nr:hypothetical protein [Armatimonadota bacterium]